MFENRKVASQWLRSHLRWNQFDNKASKEFYWATREKCGASSITELEAGGGVKRMDQRSMEEVCINYYDGLYTTGPSSATKSEVERQAFCCISDRLSGPLKSSMAAPMTLAKLLKALAKWKATLFQVQMESFWNSTKNFGT